MPASRPAKGHTRTTHTPPRQSRSTTALSLSLSSSPITLVSTQSPSQSPSTPRRDRHVRRQTPGIPPTPSPSRTNLTPYHDTLVRSVLSRSLAPRTAANYDSATRAFREFCGTHGYIDLPASELTLCAYAAQLATTMVGSSIAGIMSAIKSWHTENGAAWPKGDMLRMALRGAANMAPASLSSTPREPVTIHLLEVLAAAMNLDKAEDRAFIAVALVAFWGLCRLGELLDLLSDTMDAAHLPSRESLGASISAGGSRSLHLPRTKTSQRLGERITITAQRPPVDPIAALETHLRRSQHMPNNAHLFAYFDDKDGLIRVLSKKRFLARCNKIWASEGIETITGHCFRIGGTTALLKAGVPPEVVKTFGRWRSDAFYKYWRDADTIAATHVEHIGTTTNGSHLVLSSGTGSTHRPLAVGRRRLGDRR